MTECPNCGAGKGLIDKIGSNKHKCNYCSFVFEKNDSLHVLNILLAYCEGYEMVQDNPSKDYKNLKSKIEELNHQ